MRTLVLAIAAVLATASAALAVTTPVRGQAPIPVLYLTILGEQSGGAFVFTPNVILIPQVPILLNITFLNNESATGPPIPHTFSINNDADALVLDIDLMPQQNRTFELRVNAMDNLTYNGTSFKPVQNPDGSIRFYCRYHLPGMVGSIVLASAAAPTAQPEKGIFLRAYWIGMIGIVAMLVWIGISYFVIKSSSPHFKDHKEHVRKGLP